MISKTIAAVLVCVVLHSSVVAETQSQTQTVVKNAASAPQGTGQGQAVKITLRKKMANQRKFMGKVREITDAGFSIVDQKTGKTMSFAYKMFSRLVKLESQKARSSLSRL